MNAPLPEAGNYGNIPDELKQLNQWLVWRYEGFPSNKPTKVPYNPRTGGHASTTDPQTWCPFDYAVKAVAIGGWDGIGFVFSERDPYCGIDLDTPTDPETGISLLSPEDGERQQAVFTAMDSYSELSPSGKGLHIITKANVPHGRKRQAIEIYSSARFFTMTGAVYHNAPIVDRQELVQGLWTELGNKATSVEHVGQFFRSASESDDAVLERAMQSDKFLSLWHGDGSVLNSDDKSGSSIDQGLVNTLALHTKDPDQIERIWLTSPHGQREKTQRRKDYRQRTIRRAFDREFVKPDLSELRATLDSQHAAMIAGRSVRPNIPHSGPISAADLLKMDFPPVVYLVPGYIVEGVSLLAGAPKIGKSWWVLEVAIGIATGGTCLGGIECEHGVVLYLALEDNRRRIKSPFEKDVGVGRYRRAERSLY